MAVTPVNDTNMRNVSGHQLKRSTNTRTIAGNISLVANDADVLAIDGGASNRNILLYAPTPELEGRSHEIHNFGATNDFVVQIPGPSTLITIGEGQSGIVRIVNGVWRGALWA